MYSVASNPHSSSSSMQSSIHSPNTRPVINDPQKAFAIVQNKMPKHVRVNHKDRIIFCHESVKNTIYRTVAAWNKLNPNEPSYSVSYVTDQLWKKHIAQV